MSDLDSRDKPVHRDGDREHLAEPDETGSLGMGQSPEVPAPDRFEYGVRFGCGAAFGVFVAVTFFLVDVRILIAAGVVCGFGAATMGDRFWKMGVFWPFSLWR